MNNTEFTQVGDNLDNFLFGEVGADIVDGKGGNDYISADEGEDLLFGDIGNDLIQGGKDSDVIFGEAGDDRLIGSDYQGNYYDYPELANDPFAFANEPVVPNVFEVDTFVGGRGSDTFVLGDYFNAHYRGQSYAVIEDFDPATGDKLEVFGRLNDYTLGTADLSDDGITDAVLEYQGDAIAYLSNYNGTILPEDLVFSQEQSNTI
ncbi:MAG: hypothetical protein HC930_13660 [Hydrococcus sp. SU_1_0]|nr:hypothetical protein [Hydrococcus sp. SU_1_0]